MLLCDLDLGQQLLFALLNARPGQPRSLSDKLVPAARDHLEHLIYALLSRVE